MKVIQVLLAAVLLCSCSVANLSVVDGWVRLLPPNVKTTAAYMTLISSESDSLVSVASPQAERVEMHKTSMENGVMSMSQVELLAIKAGEPMKLEPGGYHLMLIGLKDTLNEGDVFQLTLSFAEAGDIKVELPVKR